MVSVYVLYAKRKDGRRRKVRTYLKLPDANKARTAMLSKNVWCDASVVAKSV